MDLDIKKLQDLREQLSNRQLVVPSETPVPETVIPSIGPLIKRAIATYQQHDFSQPQQYSDTYYNDDQNTSQQSSILPTRAKITQYFGQRSKYDVFSGNRNYGVDFGVKPGTPVALPKGEWEVVDAFNKARRGFIGNRVNKGYGNSVLVRNRKTGEMLRFSHLNGVNVRPGMIIGGGTVIGATGATGNVTGPHLDLEYYTPQGRLSDVLRSRYAKYLFGSGRPQKSSGGEGGGFDFGYNLGKKIINSNLVKSIKEKLQLAKQIGEHPQVIPQAISREFIYNPETKRVLPQSPYWKIVELNNDPYYRKYMSGQIRYKDLPEEVKKKDNELSLSLIVGMTAAPEEFGKNLKIKFPNRKSFINEFETNDPYVYHLDSTNAPIDSFAKEGIRVSEAGQGGRGAYLANAPEATLYYVNDIGDGTLYRVDKKKLIDKFGLYSRDNPNGIQFDSETGEIIVPENVPPEFIEVKRGDKWTPLKKRYYRIIEGDRVDAVKKHGLDGDTKAAFNISKGRTPGRLNYFDNKQQALEYAKNNHANSKKLAIVEVEAPNYGELPIGGFSIPNEKAKLISIKDLEPIKNKFGGVVKMAEKGEVQPIMGKKIMFSHPSREIIKEKNILRSGGYKTDDVKNFINKFFNKEKYANLIGKDNVYIVAPSGSGKNIIPPMLARRLKDEFGGEMFNDIHFANGAESKTKSYLDKLFLDRAPKIGDVSRLRGKNLVFVDDIVTSGGTIAEVEKELNKLGLRINDVASLGSNDRRFASKRDVDRLAEKLSKYLGLGYDKVRNNIDFLKRYSKIGLNNIERNLKEKNARRIYEKIIGKGVEEAGPVSLGPKYQGYKWGEGEVSEISRRYNVPTGRVASQKNVGTFKAGKDNLSVVHNIRKAASNKLEELVKKKWWTTDNPKLGVFITSDGKVIDGSGRVQTSRDNWPYMTDRIVDHREIAQSVLDESGNDALIKYMDKTGNVRLNVSDDEVDFDMIHMPTKKMLDSMRRISMGKTMVVDITSPHGETIKSGFFENWNDFLKFIKKYFKK